MTKNTADRVSITVENLPNLSFLYWETVKLDGKIIGTIGRNTLVEDNFYFSALKFPVWLATIEHELKFCGHAETLIGAHNLAQTYANWLIENNSYFKK